MQIPQRSAGDEGDDVVKASYMERMWERRGEVVRDVILDWRCLRIADVARVLRLRTRVTVGCGRRALDENLDQFGEDVRCTLMTVSIAIQYWDTAISSGNPLLSSIVLEESTFII